MDKQQRKEPLISNHSDILVVNDSDTEIRAIKRMLKEAAPHSTVSSLKPRKNKNINKPYNWQQHQVLMLGSNTGEYDILNGVKKLSRSKRPYTVMLSDDVSTKNNLYEDISGVAERLQISSLNPELLNAVLQRAHDRQNPVDEGTLTPIASNELHDSIIALGKSAFDTPFNDVDINNGSALIRGYIIERLIGVGGMSSAYLAIRECDQTPVAIKTLKPRSLKDDRVIDRFIKEFQIGRSINHKHIVKIHEQKFTDEFAYIVMDYIPGDSLKSRIQYPITPRQAVKYALDIASALMGLHDMGIVHRDIKPSNFHLNEYNHLVLLDFGVSKTFNDEIDLTNHGEPIGTPQFMSPEQILEKPVDHRSDLYSLGVILFKMLTGKYPYRSIDTIDLMYKHAYIPAPSLPFKLLGLENIVTGLLEKDPDYRYQTAEQVYYELVDVLMSFNRYISQA